MAARPEIKTLSDVTPSAVIYIVDDDVDILNYLENLFGGIDHECRCFASARDFLEQTDDTRPGVLLLDMRMPGMSGLELQQELVARDFDIPVIFMSAFVDVPVVVQAMRDGAEGFVTKPFSDQALFDQVSHLLEREAERYEERAFRKEMKARITTLTPREKEVFDLVTEGLQNKQIATELEISPKTVELHRANVMQKLGCRTAGQLIRVGVLYA